VGLCFDAVVAASRKTGLDFILLHVIQWTTLWVMNKPGKFNSVAAQESNHHHVSQEPSEYARHPHAPSDFRRAQLAEPWEVSGQAI
jgi:hypothetical protein